MKSIAKKIAERAETEKVTKLIRQLKSRVSEAQLATKAAEARWAQAEKEIEDYRKKLSLYEATRNRFYPISRMPKIRRGGNATALIVASDWHLEQKVSREKVAGLNEFNLEIAKRRIEQIGPKAVYLTNASRKVSDIRTCVLALLGDMMTGAIHEELLESNELSPCQAVMRVQSGIKYNLQYLLDHGDFEQIDVVCTVGNHGRTTPRMRVATRVENNFEWLAYQNVAAAFEHEPRVRFHIANGYHVYHDIQGWRCRFHHGDGLKYMGGVGGLSIPVNKAIAQWNKSRRADFDFFGHWHQFLWHRNWVCCPCLIGYDDWALWIKAEFEEPAQAYGVIDRERGIVEMRRIFVERPAQNMAA